MQTSLFTAALLAATLLTGTPRTARAQSPQPPAYQWLTGAYALRSSTNYVVPGATAMGLAGDIYTDYHFMDTLLIGSQAYSGAGNWSFGSSVLVHHNAAGAITGTLLQVDEGWVQDLKTDGAGNVYAVARFRTGASIGTLRLTSTTSNSPDYVIVKWNAAGAYQWHLQGTTTRYTSPEYHDHLAVDALGRVAVAGAITSPLTLGAFTLNPSGTVATPFCALLDAAGTVIWAKAAVGVAGMIGAWPTDLAADPATGALLLGGIGPAGFTWDGRPVGTSGYSLFWMRLDAASGVLRNSFSMFNNQIQAALVAPAGNGDSYLAFSGIALAVRLNGSPVLSTSGYGSAVVARLDAAGLPQWVEVLSDIDSAYVRIKSLTVDPAAGPLGAGGGRCYIAGDYAYKTAVPMRGISLPRTSTYYAAYTGFAAARDGLTGAEVWSMATGEMAGNSRFYSTANVISASPTGSGELALVGGTTSASLAFNALSVSYPAASGTRRGFAAKLTQAYNTLTGAVYLDANGNGQPDAGESPVGGAIVTAQPDGGACSTDAAGYYAAIVDLAAQTLSLTNPPLYHTVVPVAPTSPAFASYGNVSGGHDFALRAVPGQQDLRVRLTPISRARPGFAVSYRVTYRNVGTVAQASGAITLELDPALTYLSSTGGGAHTGTTLTTPYTTLLPGQERDFDVLCQLPTTTVIGTPLVSTATITPLAGDLTPADNVETNQLTVTGAYDPNDIQVNWPTLTPSQVTAGEWLEYTVRFQNLGTDTAFSVLLRDSLPAGQLNLGSLELIAASHSCTWTLRPGGLLAVQFTNIRLPHAGINTVGSLGFVRFRVKPAATLTLGDLIPNRADIHFDFNAPVTTNTALTSINQPTGVPTEAASDASAVVWPNPATNVLHLEARAPEAGPLTLTLLDALGRAVLTQTVTGTAASRRSAVLDLSGLPTGFYLLRGTGAGAAFTRRVVVK